MKFFSNKRFTLKAQKPQNPNRFELKSDTFLRVVAHLFLLTMMASLILTGVTLKDRLIEKKFRDFASQLFHFTTQHGFAIEDIVIEGREKTSIASLSDQINLSRNDSILQVDLKEIKTRIEDLPWVDKVELKRSYFPNILQISLKEKDIIALYQENGKFYPIDKNGKVIETEYTPNKPYLIVVGERAPEKFFELLNITSSAPELQARIKAAVLHSARRWDLIFDDLENGITVKMPEKDLDKAWQKLIKIQNKYGIFKRKLTFIDLRYQDKVAVDIGD